jgi:hypothetical protein
MSKYPNLLLGQCLLKINGDLYNDKPSIKIKRIDPWSTDKYLVNGRYVVEMKYIKVINEHESNLINKAYSKLDLSISEETEFSCIRKDNGMNKVVFPEKKIIPMLYKMSFRNPDYKFEAYKCRECGGLHVGKVTQELV